jgi:hypothetical protein
VAEFVCFDVVLLTEYYNYLEGSEDGYELSKHYHSSILLFGRTVALNGAF